MNSDSGKTFLRVFLLFGLAALTITTLVIERRLDNIASARKSGVKGLATTLPVLGQVPPFSFIERNGKPFGSAQLKSKVWIADFIYTRCMGPCPTMSRQMAEIQKSIPEWPDICLVSFSVDPEFDNPAVLREYAKRFETGTNQWFFVTGKLAELQHLAREGFKLSMEKPTPGQRSADEDPIIHDSHFILVDRLGRIRGYYDNLSPNASRQLLNDAKNLLKENL